MRPFVLVQIHDGSVINQESVGTSEVIPIVIDWDEVELDPFEVRYSIAEIEGRYLPGETIDPSVRVVLDRLNDILDENEDSFEDEEDYWGEGEEFVQEASSVECPEEEIGENSRGHDCI